MKLTGMYKNIIVKTLIILISIITANCTKDDFGDVIITKFYEEGLTASYLEDYFEVDLNNDGVYDLAFGYESKCFWDCYLGVGYYWGIKALNENFIRNVVDGGFGWNPYCFEIGEEIVREHYWRNGWIIFEIYDPCSIDLKTIEKDTAFYMGYYFQIDSEYHYAWLNVEIIDDNIILNSYGYNNTPEHTITAGRIK